VFVPLSQPYLHEYGDDWMSNSRSHVMSYVTSVILPAAGLVFVPLSQPYLHEYGDDWMSNSPRRLVDKALNSLMQKPDQQIIVLSQVLVDDINTGYQQFQNLQVRV
jgi:hypothetical protein